VLYFQQVGDILGYKPNVSPHFTVDSSSGNRRNKIKIRLIHHQEAQKPECIGSHRRSKGRSKEFLKKWTIIMEQK